MYKKIVIRKLFQKLKFWKSLIILTAFCIMFTLSACKTVSSVFQEPVISLYSAEMTKIDFTGADFLCKIKIENPNAISIPLPEVGWELFIDNNSFISGVVKNNQRISARWSTIVNVPVRLNYIDVLKSFQSLLGKNQTAYTIALDTKFSLPVLGDKVWHFEHNGDVPMLQLPKVSMPSMKVDSMDLTKAEILVTLNLENPNAFALPRVKASYEYLVNRNSFLRGSMETDRSLAAGSTTPVSIRFPVNYADLYRSIQSLQTSGETTTSLNMTVDFGIPAFSGENFTLEIPGTLPLLR